MHDGNKKLPPTAPAHGSPTSAKQSSVEAFIEELKKQQAAVRGRLVFALDATASRQPTWDAASKLTADMFQEVGTIGGLEMKLVYFRGTHPGECKASDWIPSAEQLTRAMEKITCVTGLTQIGKVLDHVLSETKKLKVSALVFVGDAMEENPYVLVGSAAELGRLGVPVFMFHEFKEGDDPQVGRTFREIAQSSKGAYCRFNAGSAYELGKLLRAVTAFAAGGPKALEGRKDNASVKLLTQIKKKE
jgi:hypothetical protein